MARPRPSSSLVCAKAYFWSLLVTFCRRAPADLPLARHRERFAERPSDILSPLLRLVPATGIFSLSFCDWCLLWVYSLFPSAIGACYGYILSPPLPSTGVFGGGRRVLPEVPRRRVQPRQ
eukprot:604961-Prorocentrum_minimum.AAC.1